MNGQVIIDWRRERYLGGRYGQKEETRERLGLSYLSLEQHIIFHHKDLAAERVVDYLEKKCKALSE